MKNQFLSEEQLLSMAEKIAQNNHFCCAESVLKAFYSYPPAEYVENIADFSNDYLADFLRCYLWEDVDFLSQYFDWKQFNAVQWGKLTAHFGNKLNDKSDVIPYWGHEEWAYIISKTPEEQLAATVCDCDKWDEFTAKNWGSVYGRCDEVDNKVKAALKNFSIQEWYDFLTNCEYCEDFEKICPCLNELREKYRDFNDYMPE